MKKPLKIVLGVVVALVVLLLGVLLTLPLTINPIVKTAASVGGPKVLGVSVNVGDVKLSPLAGRLTISKLSVGNPAGFSDRPSFAVDKVDVGLNIRSLLGDTIVVRKIVIDAPAISYESKDGQSNFDVILANAKNSEREEKAKKPKEKKEAKKTVIEEFQLNAAKVSYTSAITFGKPLTLPLPSVALNDIGKSSGGVTAVEAVTEIVNAVTTGLTGAVKELAGKSGEALSGLLKTGKEATSGVSGALNSVTSGGTETVKDAEKAVKDTADSLKKLFK